MFKRIIFSILGVAFFGTNAFSQAVTITDISSSGHFANATVPSGCAMGLPVVTATFLSGTGTSISNGVIQCTNPCGTTTVRITLSNVRWSQNPNQNWIHGISFTPGNVTVSVPVGGLPAGWAPFASSTGSCSAGITTGTGFYYDGTALQNCCPGTTANDGIPGNNYGDQIANCGFDYTFTFDLTFCNTSITNNPLVFSARGTSDYQTGCWTGVDNIGTSRIQFVLSTTPCSVPVFSTNPSATAPVKSCSGSTVNYTSTLTSACGSGSQVTWWDASTGGTVLGSGSPFVYDPPGSACPAGITIYAACCPLGSTCVTRRAFLIPGTCALALAITNVATTNPNCATPTGSINVVTVTGASGAVNYTLNPGNLTNTTGVFTGLTGLNYTLTATDASGCSATANVVFTPVTGGGVTPTVTTPVAYCQGQTIGVVPISATAATGGTLSYFLPTGGSGLSTAPTPSTAVTGTFTYTVTQTIAGCISNPVPIVVFINPNPTAPAVISPVNYCLNAIPTALVANAATGATLNWYGTNVTGGTASSTAPIPPISTVGGTNYYVSQTLGNCEGPRSVIIVNVGALPAAPGTSNVSYCQGTSATPLTVTAVTGAVLNWYGTNATGGLPSSTAPTPLTNTVGSVIYYVSQAILGCESPRASITVIVNATPPSPVVGTPPVYCQGATATALTASTVTGATLNWYGTNATGGTASATATIPSASTIGNTVYYVSQSLGTCEGPRTAITVSVNATPNAPVVTTPVNYCLNATASALIATAAPGAILNWYGTNATGGTASSTATTPTTFAVGTINYYVSQSLGICEGQRALIAVTVISLPTVPVVTPLTYCQSATTLTLTATGSGLLWYAQATGGLPLQSAPTPTSTTVGTQTFYVSQTVGNCESPRATLVVTVSARPAAPIVETPLTYCQNGNAVPLIAQGTGLLYFTSPTGGTGILTLTPNISSVGSTTYYVSQSTGTCEGLRAAIVINVRQQLSANAGNNVTIARGAQTQLNGTITPAGSTYLWSSLNAAPLALTNATSLTPIANPLQTTTYRLSVSDGNLPPICPSVFSDVVVNVIVNVVPNCINVRNAFTPNGDGINDTWFVYDQEFCLKANTTIVNVFNRYGSKVFESKNYTNNWDGTYKGKVLPDGTYYGVIEFTLIDGNKKTVKTDITILR